MKRRHAHSSMGSTRCSEMASSGLIRLLWQFANVYGGFLRLALERDVLSPLKRLSVDQRPQGMDLQSVLSPKRPISACY